MQDARGRLRKRWLSPLRLSREGRMTTHEEQEPGDHRRTGLNEGKSKTEGIRCLKRYVAREIYQS